MASAYECHAPVFPFLPLGSLASPPTVFLILSTFVHACVDVSPPYPALRNPPRLAICTVGKPPSIVTTRSQLQVIGEVVAPVGQRSGIALSPAMRSRYRQFSKNRDLVSVLCVRTSWSSVSLPSPASHALDLLTPYCCTWLVPYCPLPCPSSSLGLPLVRDPFRYRRSLSCNKGPRERHGNFVQLALGLSVVAGIPSAEWLSSLGDSPRPSPSPAIYSTVVRSGGYRIPWYSTTSLDVFKVCCSPITGDSPSRTRSPLQPFGLRVQYLFPFGHPAIVVLSFPRCRPWAVRFVSCFLGSLLKGFFAPVRLYVGFLRVWLSYAFLPISLGWWLVCG